MKSTELQKIICGMKKIVREAPKVSLLCGAMSGIRERRLLQLQFLLHDFVQVSQPAFLVIRFGIFDFELMQLLAAARDGRADGSFAIGRLELLRDEGPHQFPSSADYVNVHCHSQS
jgi:hypothetical protein